MTNVTVFYAFWSSHLSLCFGTKQQCCHLHFVELLYNKTGDSSASNTFHSIDVEVDSIILKKKFIGLRQAFAKSPTWLPLGLTKMFFPTMLLSGEHIIGNIFLTPEGSHVEDLVKASLKPIYFCFFFENTRTYFYINMRPKRMRNIHAQFILFLENI